MMERIGAKNEQKENETVGSFAMYCIVDMFDYAKK